MSKSFGVRLKEMRIENNLTQEELALQLKVGRSSIGGYENGLNEPTESVIKKLSEIFGVTTDYVLGLVPFEREEPKIK